MAHDDSPEPAADQLVQACLEVGFLLRQALASALGPYGVTPEQREVLALLGAGHASPGALSDASGRDKTTLSRVLARAGRAELLEQERRAEDRRKTALRLTPRGAAIVEQTARQLAESAPKLLSPLSPKERRRLAKILAKLKSGLAR